MSPEQAARAIYHSGGRFFACVFIKRTTGEKREMWCRFARISPTKGSHRTRSDLIVVWDQHQHGYRSIPIDGLLQLTIDGTTYTIGRE